MEIWKEGNWEIGISGNMEIGNGEIGKQGIGKQGNSEIWKQVNR